MGKTLQNKLIYFSVDKESFEGNIQDYRSDLVIEQNIQTSTAEQYINFVHKIDKNKNFRIYLSKFKKPSILMQIYHLKDKKVSLKGNIQRIVDTRVEKPEKKVNFKQLGSDEDDQEEQKVLVFGNADVDQQSSDQISQPNLAPSSDQQPKIRQEIIQILRKRKKVNSAKDLSLLLKKQYRTFIPEKNVKQIAMRVCINDKKSRGFMLRPQYEDQQEMEGRKKVKMD